MELLNYIYQLGAVFSTQGFFEVIIIVLSFGAGRFSQIRGAWTLINVAIIVFKMADWYYKTHPHAKQAVKNTTLDEKLTKLYDKKLRHHDENAALAPLSCLGAGEGVILDDTNINQKI